MTREPEVGQILFTPDDDIQSMVVLDVIPLENPSADDAYREPGTTGLPTVECHIVFGEVIAFSVRDQLDN